MPLAPVLGSVATWPAAGIAMCTGWLTAVTFNELTRRGPSRDQGQTPSELADWTVTRRGPGSTMCTGWLMAVTFAVTFMVSPKIV
jgi:hypothetical protein